MRTPNGYDEIAAMFGNPSGPDGTVNPVWQAANITNFKAPAGWKLYYQDTQGPVPISSIQIHKALAPTVTNVLREIWDYARRQVGASASDAEIRQWLNVRRLDLYGGAYNYRKKRSTATQLSLHSYGIAMDWDPVNNPMKKPLTRTLPDWWYDIWKANGWNDGRRFLTPDPMHVQFATGA